jgi:hypothetical protein
MLDGSRVIPVGWSKHHQPVAEGTMTGACTIRDPGATVQGEFDNSNGTFPSTPAAPYYTGPCRAQQQKQPQVATTGDQKVSTHDYLVTVPASVVAVKAGHILTVTAAEDTSLIGRPLQVTDVQRGTEIWERDLICIDHLG